MSAGHARSTVSIIDTTYIALGPDTVIESKKTTKVIERIKIEH